MSKASKRQKLTQEELKEENKKLRQEMAQRDLLTKEDQQRIVDVLSTQNIIAYVMVLFLPPVGVWYIWTRREKLHLNIESVLLWTFVGTVIFFGWIRLILQWTGVTI
jgi:hypothetical protein